MAARKELVFAVFNKPESCWDCPCSHLSIYTNTPTYCELSYLDTYSFEDSTIPSTREESIPDFCPLHHVELKIDY